MATQIPQTASVPSSYDQDYYLWLAETAWLLREGKLSELDVSNLIEEIEDMGKREKRSVESNLIVTLMHLLKFKYQPEERTNSWRATIREPRRRLKRAFEDSPSLKKYFAEVFNECYQDAAQQAADETGLPLITFPHQSPFSPDETLNPDYLP